MFKLLAAFLLTVGATCVAVDVSFDCAKIPQTCNNMCYHKNNFIYNTMTQRRNAAGCGSDNRCKSNPPDAERTTCDEYPFASTTNWYAGTGAGTRCVSLAECKSQGGTLSAAYRGFGGTTGTSITAVFQLDPNDPNSYCANPKKASDGQFQEGVQPPVRRGLGPKGRSAPPDQNWYRLASGRMILAIGHELANGTNVLTPKNWWDTHPEFAKRDDGDNDSCDDTVTRMMKAVEDLGEDEVAWYDTVVERVDV